jgi:hypothetical protein
MNSRSSKHSSFPGYFHGSAIGFSVVPVLPRDAQSYAAERYPSATKFTFSRVVSRDPFVSQVEGELRFVGRVSQVEGGEFTS